jgi:hypothetical protein
MYCVRVREFNAMRSSRHGRSNLMHDFRRDKDYPADVNLNTMVETPRDGA